MSKLEEINKIIERAEKLKESIKSKLSEVSLIDKDLSVLENNQDTNTCTYEGVDIERLLMLSDSYKPNHYWDLKKLLPILGMSDTMGPVMKKVLLLSQNSFINGKITTNGVYNLMLHIHTDQTVVIKREIAKILAESIDRQRRNKQSYKVKHPSRQPSEELNHYEYLQ